MLRLKRVHELADASRGGFVDGTFPTPVRVVVVLVVERVLGVEQPPEFHADSDVYLGVGSVPEDAGSLMDIPDFSLSSGDVVAQLLLVRLGRFLPASKFLLGLLEQLLVGLGGEFLGGFDVLARLGGFQNSVGEGRVGFGCGLLRSYKLLLH